jgi:hypothetical protein
MIRHDFNPTALPPGYEQRPINFGQYKGTLPTQVPFSYIIYTLQHVSDASSPGFHQLGSYFLQSYRLGKGMGYKGNDVLLDLQGEVVHDPKAPAMASTAVTTLPKAALKAVAKAASHSPEVKIPVNQNSDFGTDPVGDLAAALYTILHSPPEVFMTLGQQMVDEAQNEGWDAHRTRIALLLQANYQTLQTIQ